MLQQPEIRFLKRLVPRQLKPQQQNTDRKKRKEEIRNEIETQRTNGTREKRKREQNRENNWSSEKPSKNPVTPGWVGQLPGTVSWVRVFG
jgi:hypothetical protein